MSRVCSGHTKPELSDKQRRGGGAEAPNYVPRSAPITNCACRCPNRIVGSFGSYSADFILYLSRFQYYLASNYSLASKFLCGAKTRPTQGEAKEPFLIHSGLYIERCPSDRAIGFVIRFFTILHRLVEQVLETHGKTSHNVVHNRMVNIVD